MDCSSEPGVIAAGLPTGMPSGARTDAPDAAGTRTVNTSEGNVPH